jgi:hypothetical protein
MKANEAFDIYRDLYYEGGVSSVYFWNLDDGFAGVVLLKKCKLGPFFFFFALSLPLAIPSTDGMPRCLVVKQEGARNAWHAWLTVLPCSSSTGWYYRGCLGLDSCV